MLLFNGQKLRALCARDWFFLPVYTTTSTFAVAVVPFRPISTIKNSNILITNRAQKSWNLINNIHTPTLPMIPSSRMELLSRVLQIKICVLIDKCITCIAYYTHTEKKSSRKLPIGVCLSVCICILYFVNSKINISGFHLHINLWQPVCAPNALHMINGSSKQPTKYSSNGVWHKRREKKSRWICVFWLLLFCFKRVRVYVYSMEIVKLIWLVIFGLRVCCVFFFLFAEYSPINLDKI